ncbi:MAG: four helix bundle protein [Alphaproteobacteria bacterium]|nr:four helix bundle protein [Alphaproteobacteria bacterium]
MIGNVHEKQFGRVTRTFEDLDVWQKAFSVSVDVHKATLAFPKEEQYALAGQMRRASKGVCANIAEGFAKQKASKAEFKRFLQIALGSANEMLVWIRYCEALGYVDNNMIHVWKSDYDIICRMLNALYHKS